MDANVSLIITWLTLAFCPSTTSSYSSPPVLPHCPHHPHLFTTCICAAAFSSIMDEEVKHNPKKEPNAGIISSGGSFRTQSWELDGGVEGVAHMHTNHHHPPLLHCSTALNCAADSLAGCRADGCGRGRGKRNEGGRGAGTCGIH